MERLWDNTRFFKAGLERLGFNTGLSESPITPVIAGDSAKAKKLSDRLFEEGVFAQAIALPDRGQGQGARPHDRHGHPHPRGPAVRARRVCESRTGARTRLIHSGLSSRQVTIRSRARQADRRDRAHDADGRRSVKGSASDRARELFDTYTRDLSLEDLQRLFTHDTPDAYRFFTPRAGRGPVRGHAAGGRARRSAAARSSGVHAEAAAGAARAVHRGAPHRAHRHHPAVPRVRVGRDSVRHAVLPDRHAHAGLGRRHVRAARQPVPRQPARPAGSRRSAVAQGRARGRARDPARDAAERHLHARPTSRSAA